MADWYLITYDEEGKAQIYAHQYSEELKAWFKEVYPRSRQLGDSLVFFNRGDIADNIAAGVWDISTEQPQLPV